MKHLANQNGSLNSMIRVFQWSPTGSCFGRTPVSDRSLCKPDCDVTAPTQCIVVRGPVVHLVLGFGELVAATLAMFVRHGLILEVLSSRIMPFQTLGTGFPNYSTKPFTFPRRNVENISDTVSPYP